MQTHIIDNGVVVNTILATVAEAQAAYPDATCIDASTGGIGWLWDGTTLTAPPVPDTPAAVPQTLTIRQAKLVLHHAGLLDDVDAAVAAADRATQIEWEYAQEVSRTWPTLVMMATALGMTDAQLDDLFVQGAAL